MLSIGLHKDYQRKGYDSEAIRWVFVWASCYINMHRVELEVYERNGIAVAAYEKLGFHEEERLRQSILLRGRYGIRCSWAYWRANGERSSEGGLM